MIGRAYRPKKFWNTLLLFMIMLLGILASTSTVFAVYRTINLNDNAVDGQWQSVPVYTSTCSNGAINDQDEIKNAWITNRDPGGANGGWYYFRIETCAGPALSASTILAGAQFDCNNDGDFTDAAGGPPNFGDRKVLYSAGNDFTYYLSGSNANLAGGQDPGAISNSCNTELYHGERPTGSNTNVEWGFQFCDMPPGCRGGDNPPLPIHFQIATANLNGTIYDLTPVLDYSSPPTAITLQDFEAKATLWENTTLLWVISGFSLFLLGILILIRARLKAR